MPELPEVETITKRLKPYLIGKTIKEVIKHHPKSFVGDQLSVVGCRVVDITRRAKMIRIQLVELNKKNTIRNPASGGKKNLNLLIHLKMTGQLIYVDEQHRVGGGHPTEDWISQLPSRHTRVEIHFTDAPPPVIPFLSVIPAKAGIQVKKLDVETNNPKGVSTLYFNDQRLFGWIKVMTNEEVEKEFAKYAPDVISPLFTLEYFSEIVQKRSMPIKLLIMDNTIVAGIGNIYACDALNLAQISPFQKANTLTTDQIETLYNALIATIQKGIDLGGATTDGKYIDVHGFAGKYQLQARVYDKKGEKCQNCGGEILKEKLGGRGTYYCSICQKK